MIRRTIRRSQRLRRCTRVGCNVIIAPGDQYLEIVASPDHDDVGNVGWWRAHNCRACSVTFGQWPISNGGVEQR